MPTLLGPGFGPGLPHRPPTPRLHTCIHISPDEGWGVGGSSMISSPASVGLCGCRGVVGGSGWMSLGTITCHIMDRGKGGGISWEYQSRTQCA